MEDIDKMHRWARGEFTEEDLNEAKKIVEARKKAQERGIVGITGLPTSKEGMTAYAKEYFRKQRELDKELGLNTPEYNLYGIVSAVFVVLVFLYLMFS